MPHYGTEVDDSGKGQTGKPTGVDVEKDYEKKEKGPGQEITPAFMQQIRFLADLLTVKMNNIRPWHATGRVKLSNTTEEILYSEQVGVGELLVLTHASAKQSLHNPTTIQLAVERGGELIVLNRDVPSAIDITVDWEGQVFAYEGDKVKASSFSGTTADIFDFSAVGYIVKI